MPVVNSIAANGERIAAWRRDFHEHPELLFDVHRTAGIVAKELRAFGCDEVVEGVGRTGVVAVIKGRPGARRIGLRADMDALPIEEATGLPHASKTPGKMHACGHDGHTAMLLGAAQYLAETRNFAGAVVLIFQPAEEGGGGAKVMLDDGLNARFPVDEVYGMHNMPGIPVGHFAIRQGPIMAAADRFVIELDGRGGHGAMPHQTVDPLLAAAHVVTALQSIVSRNADPLESAVVSVTSLKAGEAFNVIPQTARMIGTVRTLSEAVRDQCEARLKAIATGVAGALGCRAVITYERGYPVTWNHPEQTDFAASVAEEVAGPAGVNRAIAPMMGAEDFSFMLEARPGAYIFVGNGDTAGVHHPAYDFDDAAAPYGASFWARLVERALPAA